MREIKFRGITCDNKIWAYGSYQRLALGDGKYQYQIMGDQLLNDKPIFSFLRPIKIETLGQFTGLKDKDGKEIYEGDIVMSSGSMSAEGRFHKGDVRVIRALISGYTGCRLMSGFDSEYPSSGHNWNNYDLWNKSGSLQIIGNIHENPELIK